MPSGRMRRVDEAMRAVLGDAISKGLQDPRVGFVTVTRVKTSPDLRHARVYVSVLGSEAEQRRQPRGATVRARLPPGAGSPTELRLKHTPTLMFELDDTIERGDADHRNHRFDRAVAAARGRRRRGER